MSNVNEVTEGLVIGRQVHYVSKLEPYIESPATVLMATPDFVDGLGSPPLSSDEHITVLVDGLSNSYREMDIPHGPGAAPRPGSWHWPSECCTRGAQPVDLDEG